MKQVPRALTIAGSDSGGCAGIQADLKTFAALGVHGMSAVTSLTAQNTRRVAGSLHVPAEFVELQIATAVDDIGVDAVKTGMLATPEIVSAVARQIRRLKVGKLVVDPVMVATGGDLLADHAAVSALREELFPLALVLTPNLQEAEALAGISIRSSEDARQAAAKIFETGPGAVVIKGGHSEDPARSVDLFFDGVQFWELAAPRVPTANTHGGGCTFASAIAAFLARGLELEPALRHAKAFVTKAIQASYQLGQGHGPLGHFAGLWAGLEP